MVKSIASVRISFIATVFNEEKTILSLLKSLESQTLPPSEVIITDGGSTDMTLSLIKDFQKASKLKIKFIEAKGNRSIGRNVAIKNVLSEIIVCSDAGCILDKDWIKNIVKPFEDGADVVAGYYKGKYKNIFQKCMIPYALVMSDRVNPNNFLPATRSMAFKKSIWEKLRGFDTKLSNNEDYAFARKIKENGFKIHFAKNAIVYWLPPGSFKKAFIMFYRFAKGDSEAKILRPKVAFIFVRYVLLTLFLAISKPLFFVLILAMIVWAIIKNYKYVRDIQGFVFLPLIQLTSDIAVMSGTIIGRI